MVVLHHLNWPLLLRTDGDAWVTSEVSKGPPPLTTGDTWDRQACSSAGVTGRTHLYINVSCFTCLEFPLSWFLLLSLNTRSCAHTHTIKHRYNTDCFIWPLWPLKEKNIHKAKDCHSVSCTDPRSVLCHFQLVTFLNQHWLHWERDWTLIACFTVIFKRHTQNLHTPPAESSSSSSLLFLGCSFCQACWTSVVTQESLLFHLFSVNTKRYLMDKPMFPQTLTNNWLVSYDLLLHLPENSAPVESPPAPAAASLSCSWPWTSGSPPVCSPSLLPLFSDTPPADAPVLIQTHSWSAD